MKIVRKLISRFHRDQRGTAMTEYSVQLALVLIVAVSAIRLMGFETSQFYNRNAEQVGQFMEDAGVNTNN